jgi:hypothetical protein
LRLKSNSNVTGSSLNGSITLQVQTQDGTGAALTSAAVVVNIRVSASPPLYDHGDNDVWRLSRLRWLDSTIGSDNSQVRAAIRFHKQTPVMIVDR